MKNRNITPRGGNKPNRKEISKPGEDEEGNWSATRRGQSGHRNCRVGESTRCELTGPFQRRANIFFWIRFYRVSSIAVASNPILLLTYTYTYIKYIYAPSRFLSISSFPPSILFFLLMILAQS